MTATRTRTPRPTEAQCQAAIVNAARTAGWLVHHTRPALQRSGKWATPLQGHRGFPDLVMCHPHRHELLIVELKRKPNKIEPDQQRWLDALDGAGVVAAVWFVPEEMDDLLATIVGRPR